MLTFAENVRAEMARRRRTQAWLAERLGVAPTTVGRWLSSQNRITLVDAVRIADELETPLEALIRFR